ncbi:MAG TPA: hypothetical protein PLL10_08935, partial [Elusimicrobiales bacterium]|nr:hypothetical protein [Elusimicrobiales bacterium]
MKKTALLGFLLTFCATLAQAQLTATWVQGPHGRLIQVWKDAESDGKKASALLQDAQNLPRSAMPSLSRPARKTGCEMIFSAPGTNSGGIAVNEKGDWAAVVDGNVYRNGKLVFSAPGTKSGGIAMTTNGDLLSVIDGNVYRNGSLVFSAPGTKSGGIAVNSKGDWLAVVDGNVYRNGSL